MARKALSRKKRGGGNSIVLETQRFSSLLKKIYVGGLIEDCVLEFEAKGLAGAKAVDVTNTIFLNCYEKVSDTAQSIELAIGNVGMLIKFLSSVGAPEVEMSIDGNRLILGRGAKGRRGRLNYLLASDPTVISTRFTKEGKDKDLVERVINNATHYINVTQGIIDDLSSLISTISIAETKKIDVVFSGDKVSINGGVESGHTFSLDLGEVEENDSCEDPSDDDFKLTFNAEFLFRVLSMLEFTSESPKVYIGAGIPLLVYQDSKIFWAVSEMEGI